MLIFFLRFILIKLFGSKTLLTWHAKQCFGIGRLSIPMSALHFTAIPCRVASAPSIISSLRKICIVLDSNIYGSDVNVEISYNDAVS